MNGADDACHIAIALARNCGFVVFPVRLIGDRKLPARSEKDGGHGFKDATKDLEQIAWLWRNWPGELIGVATGIASDASILDIDQKHATAVAWWQDSHPLLLPTRTYRTRSGGLHLWFRHRESVKNTQGKITLGVDTRGEGGFAVFWYAAGFECLDHSPLAPWPAWLLAETAPKPAPQQRIYRPAGNGSAALDGILRRFGAAREGERNGVLFWSACRLAERGIRQSEIEALLLPIAIGIGLSDFESRKTIASAAGRAAA